MAGGSGPKRAASKSGTWPGGMACTGVVLDGVRMEVGALGPGVRTPLFGGARLMAGGVGTEGIDAGGVGGPNMELPHCAEADCGSHSAEMNMAACNIRQAPVNSPEVVMPAISTAIAAISSH